MVSLAPGRLLSASTGRIGTLAFLIAASSTTASALRMAATNTAAAAAAAAASRGGVVRKMANDAASTRVATVLGTMSIPAPLDAEATREALDYFAARGFDQIDTAIMYQGGKSEATLGVL
ncbi:unnamed protein product [Ectocarpus sp. CCAP 1310/34]|nr:unnamed protein product [Ectocarpus sp. CCAP 1310/34]